MTKTERCEQVCRLLAHTYAQQHDSIDTIIDDYGISALEALIAQKVLELKAYHGNNGSCMVEHLEDVQALFEAIANYTIAALVTLDELLEENMT